MMKKKTNHIEPAVDAARGLRAVAGGALNVKPTAREAFSGPADLSDTVDQQLSDTGFGDQ